MDTEPDKKPISICFISPKAYPLFDPAAKGIFGGAEVDLYLLATELAKDAAFSVSFITADYAQVDEQVTENVRVIKSLDFRKNPLTSTMRIWSALERANADIYMIKTASPGVPLVSIFCGLRKKIFIYRTAHRYECDGTYHKKHPILGRLFTAALRRAKVIFAQNTMDGTLLKETIGVDSVVIANGHRLSQPVDTEKEFILWVGRTADFKRPEKFIELAARFTAEKFVMICQQATGDNAYEQLRETAHAIDNLEFHERVPFAEVDDFFKRAKVLVNTSDSEGFPNTFIQACKWQTAIASLNVNPDGFLDEFSCGVCCDGNEDKLADSLRSMLTENRYVKLGQNGRKYAEQQHDITKIIEIYKTAFTELVGRQ